MKVLIVGLGNPGSDYDGTRHNIGFEVVDQLVKDTGAVLEHGRHGYFGEVRLKNKMLALLKPTTYMNLSGKAVRHYLGELKLSPDNLLVITDDLALPFGKIRIRGKGSDGGHNGLKNINQLLGTTNYPRLRFGVGDSFSKGRQVDYVLGHWSDDEQAELPLRLDVAAEAAKAFALSGLSFAMNNFNNK